MLTLTREVRFIQNPAYGTVLLWRFACGYSNTHPTSEYALLQLAFVVLPIILHKETFDLLKSTNRPTGLHGFVDKFSRTEVGKSDVLLAIQPRAVAWRPLSWDSIQLAIRSRLLTVSPTDARIIPISSSTSSSVSASVKPFLTNAEKLGEWCSHLRSLRLAHYLRSHSNELPDCQADPLAEEPVLLHREVVFRPGAECRQWCVKNR